MKTIRTLAFAAMVAIAAHGIATAKGGGHGRGHSSSHANSSGHVNSASHYVHSYTRKDGTFVSGYRATDPNHTRNDNYTTRGNINSYTGEPGTKPRDGEAAH